MSLRAYYRLTKPGIIYGNLLTAIAGYLLASQWHVAFGAFIATLAGTSLVIAGACVFNNYLDREIDKHMARTRRRALVTGMVAPRAALIYAGVLTIVGFVILAVWVNWLVVATGLAGFVDYVALYGFSKRRSSYGTLVGSISGSTPIVAGYVAYTDRLDLGALLLFLIMTTWQMPHFYAIATYRRQDYASARLPVLPVVKQFEVVRIRIIAYIVAFTAACLLLRLNHYAGNTFLVLMVILSLLWLWRAIMGESEDKLLWGKQLFLFSLIVVGGLSVALAFGSVLP